MKTRNPIIHFFYGSFLQVLFWSLVAFVLIGFAPWLSAIYYLTGTGLWLNRRSSQSALIFLALLFASSVSGQTFNQSFHTNAFSSQNGTHVVSADLRGKGFADLVVTSSPHICLLLNNGNGTFQAPTCFGNIPNIAGVAVADFDTDGHLDIAVVGQDANQGYFAVFYGDGTGAFSGGVVNSGLMSAGSGILSGPVVGSVEGSANIQAVIAGGNCTNGSINNGIQPLNSTVIDAEFNGMNTNSYPRINTANCENILFGVADGFAIGNGFLYSSNGFTSYGFCAGPNIAVIGSYVISFQPAGNACIQQPPSTTVLGGDTINLIGDESVVELFSVTLENGQIGLAALISSPTTTTPVSLAYGDDLLHLNQITSITTNSTLPTAAVADVFRPNGTQAQDFAVLDQNGLTVFTQGTFSGAFSSSVVTFPPQAIGTSTTQQVKFTNTGTGAITPLVISSTGSSDFTQTNDCSSTLAAGTFCTITIQFLPGTVEVSSQATLTATSKLVTQPISLNGSEILFVNPVVSQSSLTFTNQIVGTPSAAQTVHLSNQGNESMSVTVTASTNFTQTDNCATVAAGGSCDINVVFDPTVTGSLTGTVSVQTTPPDSATINLSGTGVSAPSITTQPTSQIVVFPSPVTFTVAVTGTAPLTYQWSKNQTAIPNSNVSSLTYTPTATDSGASFTVKVSNTYGSVASSPAVLTLQFVPVITTQPASQTVIVGQIATFSVAASGTAPLSYAWTENGITIPGATSAVYTKTTVAADSNAIFVATVTNAEGKAVSNPAVLTIDFPVVLTGQPMSVTVLAGSMATFSVTATGTSPVYQWQRNGQNVGANAPSYSFTTTAADNGAAFDVIVSNAFGPSVTSNMATLTVNTPPAITSQTPTGGNTAIVPIGGTAMMSVTATGSAPLIYSWQHQGTIIAGANSSTFTTPALTATDDRTSYTVTVANAYGSAMSLPWSVGVVSPPVIVNQPVSTSVDIGRSAVFAVTATESHDQPLSYQWQKNGTNITGATGTSYTTPIVALTDTGTNFTVIVSDIGGSTVSSTAILTVINNLAWSMVLSPTTQTIPAGQTANYTLQIQNPTSGEGVNLTCVTTVPGGTCALSSDFVNGGSVSVRVTTPTTAALPSLRIFNWPWLLLILAGATAFATRPQLRRIKLAYALGAVILVLGGCGGGSASPSPQTVPPPTPTSHSYTVTITGQLAGAPQQQATAALVVTQ